MDPSSGKDSGWARANVSLLVIIPYINAITSAGFKQLVICSNSLKLRLTE